MGMGEPADAADSVIRAVNTMTDRRMFSLAQSKITISTVAPDTKAFETLGQAPALLAFSVHAVRDSIRQRLVPSTKVSMVRQFAYLQDLSHRNFYCRTQWKN